MPRDNLNEALKNLWERNNAFYRGINKRSETMGSNYLDRGCEPTGISRMNSLDEQIKMLENQEGSLENSLKITKSQLVELRRVRKLVSPEDEGKIKALQSVGLI